MLRTVLTLAAAASALTFAAGSAQAQTRTPDQVTVSTRHVDFNDARQMRALYAKLQFAAKSVCESEISSAEIARAEIARADRACARQALSDAVRRIGAPQLSRLDADENKRDVDGTQVLASLDR